LEKWLAMRVVPVSRKVFGLHTVAHLLAGDAGKIQEMWVQAKRRDARLERILDSAQRARVRVHQVERRVLDRMAPGVRHQGVVADYQGVPPLAEPDLEPLLDRQEQAPFVLVLDGVQDPHNLGACLRSADAAGVHAVIAPRDRAVGLTATVHKVASGAAESVPFIQVANLARVLARLRERGLWVVGTADAADASLYAADMSGPLALVLGSEGKGLRRLTREQCDLLVHIPMQGIVESLNVSVAAGVCLFEAVRQRGGGK